MTHNFRAFLGVLFALVTLFCYAQAYAGTANLTWTNPTTRTDGTAVTVAKNRVYRAPTCTSTFTLLQELPAATTYTDTTAPAGAVCYAVSALDASGLESAFATVATTIPAAKPNAPSGLTATPVVADTGAYKLRQSVDGFAFVRIGTVPLGTNCNADLAIGEYAVVPRAAVTLASRFDTLPLITFARCA
jgi:hypothetical protein